MEEKQWSQTDPEEAPNPHPQLVLKDTEDELSVRGTKLISDIYQRCNVAVCEPESFEEAKRDEKWMVAM